MYSILLQFSLQKERPQSVQFSCMTELQELYTEGLGQWSTYMGHVAGLIAGVTVDLKTSDQAGAVFTVVPKARQQAALAFLNEQVFVTPDWLQPPAIAALIGPSGLPARQVAVLNNVMSNARLGRLEAIEKFDATKAWPVAEYMAEVKRMSGRRRRAPRLMRIAGRFSAPMSRGWRAIVNPPAPPPPAAAPRGAARRRRHLRLPGRSSRR